MEASTTVSGGQPKKKRTDGKSSSSGIILKKKVGSSIIGHKGDSGKRKIPILSRTQGEALSDKKPKDHTSTATTSRSATPASADGKDTSPGSTSQRILNMVASLHKDSGKRSQDTNRWADHASDEEEIIHDRLSHKEASLVDRIEATRERAQDALKGMSLSKHQRYEAFRRSGLQRAMLKRWIQAHLGMTSVHPNIVIICAGIAKVFIGELVEKACGIRDLWASTEQAATNYALTPAHIEEAYRQLHHTPGNIQYAPPNRHHILATKRRKWR